MKQTIECNSPDEELLLSGKYVALGDFDDVIADPEKIFVLCCSFRGSGTIGK